MNRRDFTRGLASLGLAPAISLPSLGTASAGTMTAAATAEKMYFMGWYTARLNKTCSLDLLINELKLKPDVAKEIFSQLIKNNTISAPNAIGVSRTIDPLSDSYRRITGKLARDVAAKQPKPPRVETMQDAAESKVSQSSPEEEQDLEEERVVSDGASEGGGDAVSTDVNDPSVELEESVQNG